MGHVQAGRMLMAQHSAGQQEGQGDGDRDREDTHMESASPTRLNVRTHKSCRLCSHTWHYLAWCVSTYTHGRFEHRLHLPCSVGPFIV